MLLSVLLSFAAALPAFAGIGEWKSHTDMKGIRSIATDGTAVWAGTSGGIFRFDPSDSSYQKFTNAEGLTSNDVTAMFVDSYGDVWVGQQNGSIDIYSPRRGTWRYISNIADDKTKTSRVIRSFYQHGDRMYIAASFGLTVYSIARSEFEDTHLGFSSIIQPNVAAAIVFQNRIFVATSGGIAATKPGATNLTDPQSWEILSTVTTGNRFALFNGELFVSSDFGMLKYQSNSFAVTNALTGSVRIISALDTALIFSDGQFLRSMNATAISAISGLLPSGIIAGAITSDRRVYVGFPNGGVGSYRSDSGVWHYLYPNGPNANAFVSLEVDRNGRLWCASGRLFNKGFYSFDGTRWNNYTKQTQPQLRNEDSYKISLGPGNTVWVSHTNGLSVIHENGTIARTFSGSDVGFGNFLNAEGSYSDTLVYGGAVDNSGQMWFSNLCASNKLVLWKYTPSGEWISYRHPADYVGIMNIAIDREGTKWFTNADPQFNPVVFGSKKLVYFNENKNIGSAVNGWGEVTVEDGLTNNIVRCIVVDKQGDIWMGTNEGITIVSDPLSPQKRVTKAFNNSVRNQAIISMAVDPLNNKWIGTSTGVYVLSPDGIQLLDQYSVENTGGKLVDNTILSIVFDKNRGIAYFGTEKGLSSLEIAPISAKTSMATIDLSPNPVYLPTHGAVEIRGLVEESTIKVLSIYGKVLKQFPAQGGGRAFWDCTDGEGNSVATGIYIIVAHDRSGTQVASAKVAVIRK